jgi:hypothetical protein
MTRDEMLEARLGTLEARYRWLGLAFAALVIDAAIQVVPNHYPRR